jgi:hypothetical protein
MDRDSKTAVPSSIGCATAKSGWIHSMCSGSLLKYGDAAPSGWMAEQTS